MTDEARVEELLEQLLDSGGTPEEICRDCPELQSSVQSGWEELQALKAEVQDLFPESISSGNGCYPGSCGEGPTNGHARVSALLGEILDKGLTPEEVCRDCPELLSQVRRGWEKIGRIDAEFQALFPERPVAVAEAALPTIPGYEIEAVLGHGGAGVVYKARHLRLNRPVALKMLLAGRYARSEELGRFVREAESIAALRHPNIVQIYDVGDADGRPYFTMELLEGGSLARKLGGTPQPAAWCASLIATLADAVHCAHKSGIVHRDLKPGNVLLTADGVPKVTDFGLALRLEDDDGLTLTGVAMGTPSYMSPCQARGDKSAMGPTTDVYALGAILYDCLTGRPPFRGETRTATLRQVLTDDPVPPTRLNPRVPRDLQTICLKCLQKEPGQRYTSAASLADDLRCFEKGEPITARSPGVLERTVKWIRRRPSAAAMFAAGVLMLMGITAVAGWYVSDRAQRGRMINREAILVLDEAEKDLKNLRDRLDRQEEAWELLSDIDQWHRLVEQAQQAWKRAQSATVGNEALLADATRDRMQAVAAAVAREQAAYELARELDTITAEALGNFDTKQSQQRKAVAEYERVFARQGLDIHQPGTDWVKSAVESSTARFALIAALDNWAWLTVFIQLQERQQFLISRAVKGPQVARLLELARAADPDPWRDRFRIPAVWADHVALSRLAREVNVGQQSPTVLASFAWCLREVSRSTDTTDVLERALLDRPRDYWFLIQAAVWQTNSEARIGLAHAALAIRPHTTTSYCILAWCLRERGDLQGALVATDRAIAINPNCMTAYVYRGLALRDKKDFPGAVAAFQRAIEIDPSFAWVHQLLGDEFRLQGNRVAAGDAYRKAAELYQTQIDLDGESYQARWALGEVLEKQGRYAEAEQAYLAAIKTKSDYEFAYNSLARLLATCPDDKVRDGKRAVEYATTACERTGWKNPPFLDTLAAAYAAAGEFEEAVRYQTRAMDDPALRGDLRVAATQRLELYRQKKPFRDPGP
jgi:serine/threonine-protein kinase